MGSLNKACLIGNLGRDAELKYTPSGAAVATFSIATTETWTGKDGQKQEATEWHRCVLWGKQAESLAEYLQKGKQVYVEGQINTRKWEDKDGNTRYTTEIKVRQVVLLGGGGRGRDEQPSRNDDAGSQLPPVGPAAPQDVTDDDIPFAWLLPLLLPIAACSAVILA